MRFYAIQLYFYQIRYVIFHCFDITFSVAVNGQRCPNLKVFRNHIFRQGMLFTGVRESEAIGLTWDEIDFTSGYVNLKHQYVRGVYKGEGYEFTTLKNHNSRSFKLPPSGLAFLKNIKDKQEVAMRTNKEWANKRNFVFTTQEGNFCTRTSVYKHGKMIFSQIGYPMLRIHDLRHTFATLSLQQGMNVKTLSHILGHATVAFTMDKYGHVSRQMMEDATCQMEEIIQMQNVMNVMP